MAMSPLSPWTPMKGGITATAPERPRRGRYVLLVKSPIVVGEPQPRFVHVSWQESGAFRIRDYLANAVRAGGKDLSVDDVWNAAIERIPAKDELRVAVEDFDFWAKKLKELTEARNRKSKIGDDEQSRDH